MYFRLPENSAHITWVTIWGWTCTIRLWSREALHCRQEWSSPWSQVRQKFVSQSAWTPRCKILLGVCPRQRPQGDSQTALLRTARPKNSCFAFRSLCSDAQNGCSQRISRLGCPNRRRCSHHGNWTSHPDGCMPDSPGRYRSVAHTQIAELQLPLFTGQPTQRTQPWFYLGEVETLEEMFCKSQDTWEIARFYFWKDPQSTFSWDVMHNWRVLPFCHARDSKDTRAESTRCSRQLTKMEPWPFGFGFRDNKILWTFK